MKLSADAIHNSRTGHVGVSDHDPIRLRFTLFILF